MSTVLMHPLLQLSQSCVGMSVRPSVGAERAVLTCKGAHGGAGCHDHCRVRPGGRFQALQRRHPLPQELRCAACFCS